MWWLLLIPATGMFTVLVYRIIAARQLARTLLGEEDRSTDGLTVLDMVDPDDPETWLLFMVDPARRGPGTRLVSTMRDRGMFLPGRKDGD